MNCTSESRSLFDGITSDAAIVCVKSVIVGNIMTLYDSS